MLITGAVPAALAMTVASIAAADDDTVRVELASERAEVACPACGTVATRVHSRYQRTLADLPWQGLPAQRCLTTRCFFCERATCSQRIFAERFPGLVAPRGRRSSRLQAHITAIGIALGGEAGARLVAELGLSLSADTPLRSVRALWVSTIARSAKAIATGPSSSTLSATRRLTCCPTAMPTRSARGWRTIPACRS